MSKERSTLVALASDHFNFDWLIGNYIGPRGNSEYDVVYQGLAHEEALRCARCGDGFLNSRERRWYEEYRRQNPLPDVTKPTAIQEQVRYSIEQCIRDHLDQDVDRNAAIVEASREIVAILMRPIEA